MLLRNVLCYSLSFKRIVVVDFRPVHNNDQSYVKQGNAKYFINFASF